MYDKDQRDEANLSDAIDEVADGLSKMSSLERSQAHQEKVLAEVRAEVNRELGTEGSPVLRLLRTMAEQVEESGFDSPCASCEDPECPVREHPFVEDSDDVDKPKDSVLIAERKRNIAARERSEQIGIKHGITCGEIHMGVWMITQLSKSLLSVLNENNWDKKHPTIHERMGLIHDASSDMKNMLMSILQRGA